MTLEERTNDMLARYGEVCTKATACKILSRGNKYISRLIAEGALEGACAGKMVDVRSIARLICMPEQIKDRVRREKMMAKYGSEYAV